MRRTSTNLVAMVGCHGDMVTMATVSDNLFLYSSKDIMSEFRKFLSWCQKFSVKDVRVHAPVTCIKLGIPIYFIDHSEFITVQCK